MLISSFDGLSARLTLDLDRSEARSAALQHLCQQEAAQYFSSE
jgi:hypothetical protein